MVDTNDSIVVKRLVRNLRYRLTYIEVYESFLIREPHPEVVKLLHALIDAQRSTIATLTRYLEKLGVAARELPVVRKLQDQASLRKDLRSQLRFVSYGLTKAVSWYGAQLMDRQMTADPELRRLLLELGELEAASLWRTRAVMTMMGVREENESGQTAGSSRVELARGRQTRSRRLVPSSRTEWTGRQPGRRPASTGPRKVR